MVPMGMFSLGVWMQDPAPVMSSNSTLLTIFIGLIAVAMATQAIVIAVLAVGLIRAQKKVLLMADEFKLKALPLIGSAQEIVRDAVPKIKMITTHVAETTSMVRNQVQEFEATLSDVNKTVADVNRKTRGQVTKVDGMVSSALAATSHLGTSIHESIRIPVKQVAGVVAGLKTGLEVLLGQTKTYSGYRRRDL